jgi:hypothetical protein
MIVHKRLTNSLGFILRHLRLVPYLVSGAQKVQGQRVELSSSLLLMLEVQEQRTWHDIVTLDKPWFYSGTDHESIWLRPGEQVPEMTRVTVQYIKGSSRLSGIPRDSR